MKLKRSVSFPKAISVIGNPRRREFENKQQNPIEIESESDFEKKYKLPSVPRAKQNIADK